MIGLAEVFTIFFVTLGPLKVLAPFAQRTHELDQVMVRSIAIRAFLIGTVAIVVGGYVGSAMLIGWNISVASMEIAAGIVFLLVALKQLLEQYDASHTPAAAPPLPASPTAAALRLLFPIVLTPYGIATVIALLAASGAARRTEAIIALLIGVMVLNLVGMLLARRILVGATMIVLQIFGAVLAVLQLALAVQFIVAGLQGLGVVAK